MLIKKKSPHSKDKSIILYALHLPVLLLLLGVFTISAYVSSRVTKKNLSDSATAQVLGDDDEDKDDDKDEDKDDDKDDDKDEDKDDDTDNSGKGSNDDDDDKDDSKDDGKSKYQGTIKYELEDDDEDEDTDEVEFEDEDEDNKTKTEEKVQNSDGTYSITKTEIEDDKIKIEIKTYDASGKLIKEEKHEGDDEGLESESEDSTGNKLKVRIENSKMLIKSEGVTGLDNFPLFINETDGNVYVQTPNGEVKLGVMPQAVIEKAEDDDSLGTVQEVDLEVEDADTLEFKLKTKKTQRLFGVFEIEVPADVYYDSQTGDQVRIEQTFLTKILDFLSL